MQQALHHKFTPTFAKVNGNFGHTKDKWKASKSILEHNLREHRTKLRLIVSKLNRLMYELNHLVLWFFTDEMYIQEYP